MFEGLIRKFYPDYGLKPEAWTPWAMIKGLIPWLFFMVIVAVIGLTLFAITANFGLLIFTIVPGAFSWVGGFASWKAGIQAKIAIIQALGRWVVFFVYIGGRRVVEIVSYLEEDPNPTVKISEDRTFRTKWDKNWEFFGVKENANIRDGEIELKVETFNYKMRLHHYFTEDTLKIKDCYRVLAMLKDKWEDMPLTQLPVVMGGWYGFTEAKVIPCALEMIDKPDGLEQQIVLRQLQSIKSWEEHDDRMQIMREEGKQAIIAIVGSEREPRLTAQYDVADKSHTIKAMQNIQHQGMPDKFGLGVQTGEALNKVMGGPKRHFPWRLLVAAVIVSAVLYLVLRTFGVI